MKECDLLERPIESNFSSQIEQDTISQIKTAWKPFEIKTFRSKTRSGIKIFFVRFFLFPEIIVINQFLKKVLDKEFNKMII